MSRRQYPEVANAPSDAAAREISQILIRWGRRNYQDFPWRRPRVGWHALIAEVMLQRTRARNVVPVYERMVREYATPADLARTSTAMIEELIYPLGLRWRAPLVRELAGRLAAANAIPADYDELRALPGVGDYIASAWLSLHAGQRATLIDANIVRWLCRMLDEESDGETRRQKWLREVAEKMTPPRAFAAYNYAVLDFTMTICATKPACDRCPLGNRYCALGAQVLTRL